tara:strand:- start:3242 stop:4120 length:879 start_codon:yes stop_codon:yes gene_type:complete
MSKNQLNKIILGTAQFNNSYGRFNKKHLNEKEIYKIIKFCIANKISYLDTANTYDQVLKISDKKLLNKFNIIYKFRPTLKISYSSVIEDFFMIKKKFNFNQLYCFMLHDENDLNKFKQNYLIQINKLKKLKIIKKFGVSIYNFSKLEKYILDKNIDVIQLPYNIFDNRFLHRRIQLALKKRKKTLEIHARSIFLQGLLLQNSKSKDLIIRKNIDLFKKWDVFNKNNKNQKISNCINYVKSSIKIDKILIGIDSLKQLIMFSKVFSKNKNQTPIRFNSKIKKNIIDPRKWKKI